MTRTNPKALTSNDNLLKNEDGAIMIMGLAMILALIAFLWFLLGIGETLAFRDHMQESADSAAFTTSAVDALGMHLIVAINLIMLVMIAIYIGYSIVITLDWIGSVVCCPVIWTAIECCPRIPEYISDWKSRNDFAKGEAQVDQGLSIAQSIIGIATPWAGTVLSVVTSHDYKMASMASAPWGASAGNMNIPGTLDTSSTSARFGLPVTHEWLSNDCSHLMDAIFGGLTAGLGALGIGGKGLSKIMSMAGGAVGDIVQWYYCSGELLPDVSGLVSSFGQSGGTVTGKNEDGSAQTVNDPSGATNPDGTPKQVPATTTVDKFPPSSEPSGGGGGGGISNGFSTKGGWERILIGGGDGGNYWYKAGYGPMVNFGHKLNGVGKVPEVGHDKENKNNSTMMQNYSVVIPPTFSDHAASHNIAFMQLNKAGWSQHADVKPTVYFYYSQSELYFDCTDKWGTGACDDLSDGFAERMDMTMYRFEWRSRLVMFHMAGGFQKAFGLLSTLLGDITGVRSFINGLGSNEVIALINSLFGGLASSVISSIGSIADKFPATPQH